MKFLFFLIVASCSFSFSYAQKFSASVDFQVPVPQSDYRKVNPNPGYGMRGNFLYQAQEYIPIKFGIELGIQEKGRTSKRFSGSGIFSDDFKVSATNNIFSVLILTRFQPVVIGKVKPFIDLTAGWNAFFSTVEVERLTYYSEYNNSNSKSTKAKWALTYGATGGVDIPLNKADEIGLEIKMSYLIGNNTQYLTNPYIDENGKASFVQENSRTNMLIPQVGVRFSF